ncbi:MAG: hypothetical protein AAFV53_02180 [Myxococcota bacterium]
MNRWMWMGAALLLGGCVKGKMPENEDLIATKWEGGVDVTNACQEHGGYTGTDLKMCLIFRGVVDGLWAVDVDWDTLELKETCDYFSFLGTPNNEGLTLVRRDDEEPDDKLRLRFADGKLVGTFEVHPECGEWKVEMVQIPLPPDVRPAPAL